MSWLGLEKGAAVLLLLALILVAPTGASAAVPDAGTFPVAGHTSCVNDWHFTRSGGRQHKGNDCMARTGTPPLPVEAGTIARVDNTDNSMAA